MTGCTLKEGLLDMMDALRELYVYIDLPGVLLGIAALGIIYTLMKWHSEDNLFDFRLALLDDTGTKISFIRLGHFVCLITSTAILIYETFKGRINEWLYMGYMTAWAGSFIAAKITGIRTPPPPPPPPPEEDSQVKSTTPSSNI